MQDPVGLFPTSEDGAEDGNDIFRESVDGYVFIPTLDWDVTFLPWRNVLTIHCLSTMGDLKNKITSFSHKGYNQPYFLDTGRLLHRIRRGEDLFERQSELYDRIDDNPDVPAYLQTEENRQKFAYMLDRDPPNANFRDIQ